MVINMTFSSCNSSRNQATETDVEDEYTNVICKYSLIEYHHNTVK